MTNGHAQQFAAKAGGLSRVLAVEIIAPLVLFYGLRWLGVGQFPALLAGAIIPAAGAVRDFVAERRVGGVRIFVLGTMALTVAMSFVSGNPRVLLIRNGWGTAALGGWMLVTLLARRPFLYEAARVVFDEDKRQIWERDWEQYPPFRRLLRICTALWGVAFLADAAVRVILAFSLPVDAVPALDDVLLVVTIAVILVLQRVYGRSYMKRHGLRMRGVHITPVDAWDRP
ncbi:MAG TPA: VC0807 family protein [Stackebrandtia sp.]|jgi:hypothetical protein|uniref:VC0807 family protein n=1 Tax=Stackebrandtia sp. TaxID=2023065 RepID=UPI002D485ED2|nr:VC0807 family protein [Stackebrandtia sp.]HZE41025.1 VC0807 family protein [Stackebrandtia sp.]